MKKRLIPMGFLFLFILQGFSGLAWGQTEVKSYSWVDKLKRGGLNIISSPVEIARNIHNTTEEKNLLVGWTIGLAKGIGEGLVRFGAGVIDVVTCPFDFPVDRKAPMLEPEYVWQQPGPKYV
ncbi:MAG: exosortase system-associated protein, TIGR04073 family [Candidatus Omnitrophica bacterium]|nr:exosortase system-associated protein, TIGR04073 family [Candidatus Omnitrophota bacterium]